MVVINKNKQKIFFLDFPFLDISFVDIFKELTFTMCQALSQALCRYQLI